MRTRGRVQRLSCVRPSMRRARNHQSWMLPSARTPSESCDIGSKSILVSLLCHISSSEPPTEWSAGEPQTDSKSIWASCCATSCHQSRPHWHECAGERFKVPSTLVEGRELPSVFLQKRVLLDYLRKIGWCWHTPSHIKVSCEVMSVNRARPQGGTCYYEV